MKLQYFIKLVVQYLNELFYNQGHNICHLQTSLQIDTRSVSFSPHITGI